MPGESAGRAAKLSSAGNFRAGLTLDLFQQKNKTGT
jgi:hypothetical protein